MHVLRASLYLCACVLAGCASSPFEPESVGTARDRPQAPGEGPTVTTPPVVTGPTPEAEPSVEVPMPLPPAAGAAARAAGHA